MLKRPGSRLHLVLGTLHCQAALRGLNPCTAWRRLCKTLHLAPFHSEVADLQQRLEGAAARADAAESRLEQLQEANERFIEERKVRPI